MLMKDLPLPQLQNRGEVLGLGSQGAETMPTVSARYASRDGRKFSYTPCYSVGELLETLLLNEYYIIMVSGAGKFLTFENYIDLTSTQE
jgi:hypothetical protein